MEMGQDEDGEIEDASKGGAVTSDELDGEDNEHAGVESRRTDMTGSELVVLISEATLGLLDRTDVVGESLRCTALVLTLLEHSGRALLLADDQVTAAVPHSVRPVEMGIASFPFPHSLLRTIGGKFKLNNYHFYGFSTSLRKINDIK